MVIFYAIPEFLIFILVFAIGILLCLVCGSFLDIADSVVSFANENTFYVMIGIAAILFIITLFVMIFKSENLTDFLVSLISSLIMIPAITLGFTNAWTMIPIFFSNFSGFHDLVSFILFGWIVFFFSVLFYGFFAILFTVSGFIPIFVGSFFMEKEGITWLVVTIVLTIVITAINIWALINLNPYFMNSIAHIF